MSGKRFKSYQEKDYDLISDIEGLLPSWLSGDFISTGPGLFSLGGVQLNHWFDGAALLKGFHFEGGSISADARYVRTKQFTQNQKNDRLYFNEFGTTVGGVAGFIRGILNRSSYDNVNVNVFEIENDNVISVTETMNHWVVDKSTLETLQRKKYEDKLNFHMCTPHPIRDYKNNVLMNVGMQFGKETKYHVFEHCLKTGKRKVLFTYQSKSAFYMHSFFLTEKFIILPKTSVEIDVMNVLNPMKAMVESYFDNPNAECGFIVIDRQSEKEKFYPVDSFYLYHICNAYESGDDIVLDFIESCSGSYEQFTLESLESSIPEKSSMTRIVLNLTKGVSQKERILEGGLEFPRINEKRDNGKKYQYAFMANKGESAPWFNELVKLNVENGDAARWSRDNVVTGEPVLVENPNSHNQQALLAMINDESSWRSGLCILDPVNMQELAVVWLKAYFAPGLHGNFFAK